MKHLFLMCMLLAAVSAACGGGSKKTETPEDLQKNFENQKALAVASSWRGNFRQALKEIEAAEKLNDEDPEVYVIKGAIYFGLKDYPAAEQYYMKALSLNPNYTLAHFNLCGFYIFQKNYTGAISECNYVIADPASDVRPNAYTIIGKAYYSQGDMAKARENYQKALELNPSFVYAHNELGKLHMSTGRYGEAIAEFELAVAGYPGYDEAYYNLGLAYLKLNDTAKACASFIKVTEISSTTESGVNSIRYINTLCD